MTLTLTGGEKTLEGSIFVEKSMFEAFKYKAFGDGEKYKLIIDTAFRYGQKSSEEGQEHRWIVFQDNKHEQYQVRHPR